MVTNSQPKIDCSPSGHGAARRAVARTALPAGLVEGKAISPSWSLDLRTGERGRHFHRSRLGDTRSERSSGAVARVCWPLIGIQWRRK